MKKIINGKKYDTDTAREVAHVEAIPEGDRSARYEETLYQKRTGEYFLYGWGGALSRYANISSTGGMSPGRKFIPLTFEQARDWGERNLSVDDYEAEFGECSEDGSTSPIMLNLPTSARAALDREASRTGRSRAAIVAALIEGMDTGRGAE